MFPESDYGPPGFAESGVGGPVPFDVTAELRLPVPGVGRRLTPVIRAAVPEAAVNEHGDPAGGEHDVGTDPDAARQIEPQILAVTVALAVQRPPQREFRLGVGAAVSLHIRRAGGA